MSVAAPAHSGHSGLITGSIQVAKRALLVYLRTPQLIVLSSVQMATIMIGFRYVFGGAINTGDQVSYVDFAVPGFIAAGALFTTISSAAAIAEDLQSGLIDRLRSLPMKPSAVLVGRVLADVVVLAWSLAVTAAIGFLIGFRLHGTVLGALAAFGLCVLLGFAFSWVFVALGLLVRSAQGAQGLMPVIFILTFVSDAYVPADTMPSWLRGFAENQPVTLMVDAVRGLALGSDAEYVLHHSTAWSVDHAVAWAVGIVVVFATLAAVLFRRR